MAQRPKIDRDIFMGPDTFNKFREILINNSNGRYTEENLDAAGFTYDSHLRYSLDFVEDTKHYDIYPNETDYDRILNYFQKISFYNETMDMQGYSPRDKFLYLKQQLIDHKIYSQNMLNDIGFSYQRYNMFGNNFFNHLDYRINNPRKPGPTPKSVFKTKRYENQSMFNDIKLPEEIGPNKTLFNLDPKIEPEIIAPNAKLFNIEPNEQPQKLYNVYDELESVKVPEFTQTSLFEETEEDILKKKIKVANETINKQKSKFIQIDAPDDLGQVIPTYPLQFFDSADAVENRKLINFFEQYLNSDKNTRNLHFKMVGFNEEGMRVRQAKVKGMDRDYFGDTDVIDKRVMVLLPEGERKERAIAVVKQGDGYFKLAEADMAYEDGQAYVKNLNIKSSGTFASPFTRVPIKTTLNGSKYVNVPNIGDTTSGVQELLNEDYQKIFDIILKNKGNVNSITQIGEELNKSQRLIEGRSLDIIKDATMVTTRHAVSSDGLYNGKIIISGQNLLNSIFVDKESRQKLIEKGYGEGRYALETNETGKIKGIYKAVSKDGIISYEKDEDAFKDIFNRELSQYTDSYVMERAKLVDTDLKGIVSQEDIIKFNEKIRNMDIHDEKAVAETAKEMRETIFNKYASTIAGYSNYQEILDDVSNNGELRDIYKFFLDRFERVDLETIKARIESGQLFDDRLVEIKDKTTSAGIERIISSGFMHPLNYLNRDSARKTQGIQQMSSFGFYNLAGERISIARALEQQTNHIKELQSKKINIRRTAEEGLFNLFGGRIFGDNFVAPDLSANTISYLYGDFEEVFNDSTVISSFAAMKNIGDKERITKLRIDYSSLTPEILDGLDGDYTNVGSLIDRLQNGKLNIHNINQEGSFEYSFFRQLLGKENVEKFSLYKHTNGMEDELASLGKLFENIESLKNEGDMIAYAEAMDKARHQYDQILKKYMILSGTEANVNIVNKKVINKDTKGYVADATGALIENITADSTGINIELNLAALTNNGSKIMIANTKGTVGGVYNAMYINNNGQNIVVDALVNNKLTSSKRGNAGSILSQGLETMLRNTLTGDFKTEMTMEEKIQYFKDKFSSIKLSKNKENSDILSLLNIDIQLAEDGSINFIDKNVEKAIKETQADDVMNVYTTFEKKIRDNFTNNLKSILGNGVDHLSEEMLFSWLNDTLYDTYNLVLDDMTEDSKNASQVMLKNPELKKIYTGADGKQHVVTEKVKGYVFNFKDRMTKMMESLSRKNSNAMKLSRISQLMATTSGNEDFIKIIKDLAMEQNKDNVLDIAAVYDLNERGAIRNSEIFEHFVKGAKYIDVSLDQFRDFNFGILDTVEGFKNGPLGGIITDVRDADKAVTEKKVKAMITGFEEGFLDEIGSIFDDTADTKERLTKIMFFSSLDESVKNINGAERSEILKKLEQFKTMVSKKNINISNELVYKNMFSIENSFVQNQEYSYMHEAIIDALGEKLKINHSDEFKQFKKIEETIENYLPDIKKDKNKRKEFIKIVSQNLSLNITDKEIDEKFNETVNMIRTAITNKKINIGDGYEGLIDILKNSSNLNENYYKFIISMSNMLDRLNGNIPKDVDLFRFDDILHFENLDLNIIENYRDFSRGNDILFNIINEYDKLTDGKIIHLARLKQLDIYKELPVYLTGLLSDETGRIIPESGLADLINLTEELSKLYASKEYSKEYNKIAKFAANYKEITNGQPNTRIKRLSAVVNQYSSDKKMLKKSKDGVKDFLSIFGSGIDIDKLYKDNQYLFHDVLAKLGQSDKTLDDEIKKKFDNFKKMIKRKNAGTSNALGVLLEELNTEDSKYMNQLIGMYSGEDISFRDFLKGTMDLRKMLRSSGDKFNKSSLTTINNTLKIFDGFLDDLVENNVLKMFRDFQKLSEYAINNDERFDPLFKTLVDSSEHSSKMKKSANWISKLVNNIIDKSDSNKLIDEHSKSTREILSKIFTIYEKMGQGVFGKDGTFTGASTYIAENSARFSPRDASFVHTIVRDEIVAAFKNPKGGKFHQKINEIENFTKIIFGDDAGKEVKKKLEKFRKRGSYSNEELKWIIDFLAEKQNIVIGTDKMFNTAGMKLDFGKSNYYAYGLLQRDPSQFFGSIAATRFVKIDMSKKMFNNNMFSRLIRSSGGINNTADFMFIGKMTGLWANGDFDGDTYQAMLFGFRNKKLFNQAIEHSGDLYEKSLRLQNLITNSGDDNLIDIFRKRELTTENSKAIKKLILELYGGDKIDKNSSNEEIFNVIRPYYLKFRYYRNKIKEARLDELEKHADTKLVGREIDGFKAKDIFRIDVELTGGQIRRLRNGDLKQAEFEKLFNSLNIDDTLKKDLLSGGIEKLYNATKKSLSLQGELALSNVLGGENKILEYLSIARTGRFHDAISEYREFSMAFMDEDSRKLFLNMFYEEFGAIYGKESEKILGQLLNQIGNTVDDVFGDLIEQGSIGGKHGAQVNPYEIIEIMNNISKETKRGNQKNYVMLNEANEIIERLLTDIDGVNNKVIEDMTISDYARKLFFNGESGAASSELQDKIINISKYMGQLLGVNQDADISAVKFKDIEDITASKLAGILTIVNTAVAKGHIEKVTDTTNIARGLVHKINSKTSVGSKMQAFFSTVYDNTIGKKSGNLSSDTWSATRIIKNVVDYFKDSKNENEDLKESAEKTAEFSDEEIKKANAYNAKIDPEKAKNAKKAAEESSDNSKYAQETIERLRKRVRTLEDALAKKTAQMDDIKNQNNNVGDQTVQGAEKFAEKTKKVFTKAVDESKEMASKAKQKISKHKKGAMIAGVLVALGTFFKIFQSNRAVVNLDINEKQYEKSQGSIYRDLNRYTINTNIRELY